MAENEKVQSIETQTNKERATPRKPDGILTKKINGKTFVQRYILIERARIPFKISC